MADYAREATLAASIDELAPAPNAVVPLADVLRHRRAFADMIRAWHADAAGALPEALAEAAKCAATACNAPMAKVLELRKEDGVLILTGQYGLGAQTLGRSAGGLDPVNPAGEALIKGKPVVDVDVRRRPPEGLPAIMREYGVVTSVSLPLINHSGPYGILEVDYPEPTQIGAMEMSFLASVAAALAENIERDCARSFLTADRDAKIDLLREQQHRIRNNFQLIVAMLGRQSREASDAAVRTSFRNVERRVFAMASLYDHLLGQSEQDDIQDLGRYLSSMADSFQDFYALDESRITLHIDVESGVLIAQDICTAVGTVVNELVANAVEHAFGDAPGRITMSLTRQPPLMYTVSVADDGRGFDASRQENVGLQTARRIAAGIGGRLDCRRAAVRGSVCELVVRTAAPV